jgi:hypothetical protein
MQREIVATITIQGEDDDLTPAESATRSDPRITVRSATLRKASGGFSKIQIFMAVEAPSQRDATDYVKSVVERASKHITSVEVSAL